MRVAQEAHVEHEVGLARQALTAADAVRGQGAFTAPQQVQALARIYSNYTHVVVQRSSGITTMAELSPTRCTWP